MDGLEEQRRDDWRVIQLERPLNEVIIHREDR
jgi:hypothetical protein